jgi:hypothetical protein
MKEIVNMKILSLIMMIIGFSMIIIPFIMFAKTISKSHQANVDFKHKYGKRCFISIIIGILLVSLTTFIL